MKRNNLLLTRADADEKLLYRTAIITRDAINEKDRTVSLSFSSEDPVRQYHWDVGEYEEILSHDTDDVDLSFLASGRAPLLKDHDRSSQTGVVLSAEIGADRRGRAVVRFGKGELAEAEFQNVVDGIRANVSVGYRIDEMVLVEKRENDLDVYRVKWTPKEVSIVSIPADESVGVGRSATPPEDGGQTKIKTEVSNMDPKFRKYLESLGLSVDATDDEAYRFAATLKKPVDTTTIADSARTDEQARAADILAIGEMHDCTTEARKAIADGTTVEAFQADTLKRLKEKAAEPVDTTAEIGLTDAEIRGFSLMRAIRAMANPNSRQAREDAAFEFETSQAVADKMRKEPQGLFVPYEVLRHDQKRDMQVGVASQGGYLVDQTLAVGSFIEKLENSMVCLAMGAQTINGLVGDIAIPKQTGGATAYWVGEGDDVTESTPAIGQARMSPKTVGAFTDLTRKFILQSSIGAENFVRNDLALRLALKKDLAGLNGAGTPNEPLGILNTTGIGSVTINAQNTPNWGDVIDMQTEIATDNALVGKLGYATNATIVGKMLQTQAVSGEPRFIMEDGKVAGYPCLMSNQVPSLYMVFGNWDDMVWGGWGTIDVNVDTATLSQSGGVRIVVLQDCDVVIRHAESFCSGYHV